MTCGHCVRDMLVQMPGSLMNNRTVSCHRRDFPQSSASELGQALDDTAEQRAVRNPQYRKQLMVSMLAWRQERAACTGWR